MDQFRSAYTAKTTRVMPEHRQVHGEVDAEKRSSYLRYHARRRTARLGRKFKEEVDYARYCKGRQNYPPWSMMRPWMRAAPPEEEPNTMMCRYTCAGWYSNQLRATVTHRHPWSVTGILSSHPQQGMDKPRMEPWTEPRTEPWKSLTEPRRRRLCTA
jgi:hypothetical protein